MTSSDETRRLLQHAVADTLREGATIESEYGDAVIVRKRNPLEWWEHFTFLVLVLIAGALFWPVALVLIGVWVYMGVTRRIRYRLWIDDDGELQQEVLK